MTQYVFYRFMTFLTGPQRVLWPITVGFCGGWSNMFPFDGFEKCCFNHCVCRHNFELLREENRFLEDTVPFHASLKIRTTASWVLEPAAYLCTHLTSW